MFNNFFNHFFNISIIYGSGSQTCPVPNWIFLESSAKRLMLDWINIQNTAA